MMTMQDGDEDDNATAQLHIPSWPLGEISQKCRYQSKSNMQTSNYPFSVGDKMLKKNMAGESCKAKMKTKSIHNSRGYCCGGVNSRTNMGMF